MEQKTTRLGGKTALITRSAAGLGRAIAEGLAAAGCNVVLHGLELPADVDEVRAAIAATHGVEVGYVRADLADPDAIESLVGKVHSTHDSIDVLVNNAVVRHFAPVEAFPRQAWDGALAVHVSAAFHLIRLTLPGMRSRGWGRIFNMTSVYGSRGTPNRIDYVTTKSALLGMTRAVAMETVGQGVTCNAICPGTVLTPNIDMRVRALMDERGLDRGRAGLNEFSDAAVAHPDARRLGEALCFVDDASQGVESATVTLTLRDGSRPQSGRIPSGSSRRA